MTSAFERLALPVRKWVRTEGWSTLRDIQVRGIEAILETDRDVIIAANTAGGKTEAAFLPLISQALEERKGEREGAASPVGFDVLYIGPLKALISDQARRLLDMCADNGLPVVPWHGDVSASVKAKALKAPFGILLITPESLEALFVRRGADIARLFGTTRAIVIDELHTMLGTERGMQLQSLMARIELAIGRRPRRIGLSATLGDMGLAGAALAQDDGSSVELIEATGGGGAELRMQVLGHVQGRHHDEDRDDGNADGSVDDAGRPGASVVGAISSHLFQHLRGSDNLVFAGSRNTVEIYSDKLRQLCEAGSLPQEFFAHHASIAKERRQFIEKRLKDGKLPTSAICTSTLELGIDIGDVKSVAQIGAPFSVASLRQRLGRSGRREGQPSILRQYVIESALDTGSHTADRLRLGLLRAVAMIELLLEGWCEPPHTSALHLSTLAHQILSVIASAGGARAETLFKILCVRGPFKTVTPAMFADVLRCLGDPETALIEQSAHGLLMLGGKGERLVEHYSFYAVFETSDEYRIIANGKELGTVPVDSVLAPGMMIIFSGRRWNVTEVRDGERVILVTASAAGVPPVFGGDPGIIHDEVVGRMFELLETDRVPVYLDAGAVALIGEARANFRSLLFDRRGLSRIGEHGAMVFTRRGTIATNTLALALRAAGFAVEVHDGLLEIGADEDGPDLIETLEMVAAGRDFDLFADDTNLRFEKFDQYLSDRLLQASALSSRLDRESLEHTARQVLCAVG